MSEVPILRPSRQHHYWPWLVFRLLALLAPLPRKAPLRRAILKTSQDWLARACRLRQDGADQIHERAAAGKPPPEALPRGPSMKRSAMALH